MSASSNSMVNSLPAEPADSEANAPASLPMYLASLVVTFCGLYAVNLTLDDASFANLTLGLTLIGFAVSYISRRQNVAPRAIEVPAIAVCVVLALTAFTSDQMLPFLAPAGAADDRAKA